MDFHTAIVIVPLVTSAGKFHFWFRGLLDIFGLSLTVAMTAATWREVVDFESYVLRQLESKELG